MASEAYVDWRYEARYGGPVHPRAKPLPLWSQVVRPRLMDGQSPESLLRNLVFGPVSEVRRTTTYSSRRLPPATRWPSAGACRPV